MRIAWLLMSGRSSTQQRCALAPVSRDKLRSGSHRHRPFPCSDDHALTSQSVRQCALPLAKRPQRLCNGLASQGFVRDSVAQYPDAIHFDLNYITGL